MRTVTSQLLTRFAATPVACVLGTFAVSRLLIAAILSLSRSVVATGPFPHPPGIVSLLTTWDAAWYLDIAQHGYSFRPGEAGFFPFYPLLIYLCGFIVPFPYAALIVSNVCFFLAAILLYKLVALDYDTTVARDTVTLLMFSPVSFFFSAGYTESTFLLLSLAAFIAARRQKWLVAALCGMALSATRYVGFLILLPLLVEHVQQVKQRETGTTNWLSPRLLVLLLIPVGLGAFFLFCYFEFDDPLAYLHTTVAWGRKLVPPWYTFANSHDFPLLHIWIYSILLGLSLLLVLAGFWLRIRWSYTCWSSMLVATYACSGTLEGMARYLSVVFPVYLVCALFARARRSIFDAALACSAATLSLFAVLLANGYWMT